MPARPEQFSLFNNETHRCLMTKRRSGKGKVGGGGGNFQGIYIPSKNRMIVPKIIVYDE